MRGLIFILLAGAWSVSAQTHPDFSGSWKLNVAKSNLQEPELRGAVFKIVHREPDLVISRSLLYATETNDMKFALKTDGKPVVVPYSDEKLKLAVRWDDGSLLCSVRDVDDREDEADRVRYSLSPDGKTLLVTEHGAAKPRVWVLERQ